MKYTILKLFIVTLLLTVGYSVFSQDPPPPPPGGGHGQAGAGNPGGSAPLGESTGVLAIFSLFYAAYKISLKQSAQRNVG